MELTAREIAEITGSVAVIGDAFARARSWTLPPCEILDQIVEAYVSP